MECRHSLAASFLRASNVSYYRTKLERAHFAALKFCLGKLQRSAKCALTTKNSKLERSLGYPQVAAVLGLR